LIHKEESVSRGKTRLSGKARKKARVKTKKQPASTNDSPKILALDIAGKATGWAVGKGKTLLGYGKFLSNMKHNRSQRLSEFGEWLAGLLAKEEPDIVLIEKPYLGRNSNVLVNLSKYIAIAEVEVFRTLNKEVEEEWLLDPRSVKKGLKLKKPRSKQSARAKHDENKELMVRRINEIYGLKLIYDANSKIKSDNDSADAIALLHFWWLESDRSSHES